MKSYNLSYDIFEPEQPTSNYKPTSEEIKLPTTGYTGTEVTHKGKKITVMLQKYKKPTLLNRLFGLFNKNAN